MLGELLWRESPSSSAGARPIMRERHPWMDERGRLGEAGGEDELRGELLSISGELPWLSSSAGVPTHGADLVCPIRRGFGEAGGFEE